MKWEYWKWFFRGVDGQSPGLFSLLDRWVLVHLVIAAVLSAFIDVSVKDAASTVLLPLASIFIGLSFAWAGNAQALMQTEEIEELSQHVPGGLQTYAYKFQTAIFVILVTLCAWGLAGLGLFENQKNICKHLPCDYLKYAVQGCLYFLASVTLRECWHVVLGSQIMLISRHSIKQSKQKRPNSSDAEDQGAV